ALLVLGRLPRAARCGGGAFYLRRGTAARPAIILALPLRRMRRQLRHRGAERRPRCTTCAFHCPIPRTARETRTGFFGTHPCREGSGRPVAGVCADFADGTSSGPGGLASGHGGSRCR